MKIGVFHPGTQHSYQTALAFMESNQLEWLATSIFYDPTKIPYKLERLFKGKLHAMIHQKLSTRHCSYLDTKYVIVTISDDLPESGRYNQASFGINGMK